MNKTKKQADDLRKKLEKRIAEDQARKASINSEITTTKAEISDLKKRIDNYSDFDNVSEFNELKAKKTDAESRLTLLERKLTSETNLGADVIRNDYNTITKAKSEIFENFAKESAPIIEQMRTLYESTKQDLQQLQNLHQLWTNAYNIPQYQYRTFDTLNNTMQRTQQFLAREDFAKENKIPY